VKVLVRPRFYEDIAEEIYWLMEKAGSEVAEHWHESVLQTVGLLRTSPFIGRKRTNLRYPGIRSSRVEHFTRWLILYGVRADALVLYRARSGAMNLAALKLVS
jgi:plasmid stabilization system protein ParE